jgi:hypothetical protein
MLYIPTCIPCTRKLNKKFSQSINQSGVKHYPSRSSRISDVTLKTRYTVVIIAGCLDRHPASYALISLFIVGNDLSCLAR